MKQKTAYEMRISDWSSDVCSSDLPLGRQSDDGAGADAGLALQLQASAMQLHEAIGQRQAEPGALELAAETAVDLLEGREGTRDVLGGDADAGVAHLENEAAVAGAARGQRNTAAFRRSEEHTSALQSLMRTSYA